MLPASQVRHASANNLELARDSLRFIKLPAQVLSVAVPESRACSLCAFVRRCNAFTPFSGRPCSFQRRVASDCKRESGKWIEFTASLLTRGNFAT